MGGVFLPCRSAPVCRVDAAAAVPAMSGLAGEAALLSDTVRWVKRVVSVRCVVLSVSAASALSFFAILTASRCGAGGADVRRFSFDTLLIRVVSLVPVPAVRFPALLPFAEACAGDE